MIKIHNPTSTATPVTVLNTQGVKEKVFVQPNARVTIPEGYSVDPDFLSRNPRIVVTKE